MKLLYLALSGFLFSCTASKSYSPSKKYSVGQLKEDYRLFRNILEESHPSLYWYATKDSVDHYFDVGEAKLTDSMQEYKFRNVLSYVISKIHCGHTSVRASKQATAFSLRTQSYVFPLNVKVFDDTMVVTSNLNRLDTLITRGSILQTIEGRTVKTIIDSLFQHLSADGYNTTHKYQWLSNSGSFRNLYTTFFGLRQKMRVTFIDTTGRLRSVSITPYVPAPDTSNVRPPSQSPSKRERKRLILRAQRNSRIDNSLNTAFMEVNTFSTKNKLRSFFRSSFRTYRKKNVQNLVIDIRGNGGGNVTLSNLLTKYLADKPFKIADSLYAIRSRSRYGKYINQNFLDRMFMIFFTKKKRDGYHHFSMYENRYFKPRKRNHYSGTTYILTGGNTFSAATLFAQAIKDQANVVTVGEETGGGAYGNTAWLIPDVTLPNTKVRFRLPLFRLVIDKDEVKGRGVMPEVPSVPTVNAVRKGTDFKTEKVIELIKARR